MVHKDFWHKRKVFITGHTGFKGSWLTLWLASLGADIVGYSLDPPSSPYLFKQANVEKACHSLQGSITDYSSLLQAMNSAQPEIVFHLAAQPLVHTSYKQPLSTFDTNVMGTANILEAAKNVTSIRVIINVTSDKCYENDGLGGYSFQESDRLGGYDPYSASKACAELIATSYQKSFFQDSTLRLASVRAGNVIGGGDWAEGRLIPNLMRCYINSEKLYLRNPHAIRPWQHVLEPLQGYMLVAEKLWEDENYSGAWNFGPINQPSITVEKIVEMTMNLWEKELEVIYPTSSSFYESLILTLDSTKAQEKLGWTPKLSTEESLAWTVEWYQRCIAGEDLSTFTYHQINSFITK
ncbi:CDP-glucose 4,6-dehydratase [Thermoactinomyces sp. DSM 45891]|uniref:CDP-glucose 4,6-dehydratase n=1 Tax=Thermoactinomyces sp. DSM 45891 TaxID=1761907 RepID=UPI000931ACC5|nr:CDP-glucose 4,6-dehydratase [Thermoactinomyces sp. DSM 45891]